MDVVRVNTVKELHINSRPTLLDRLRASSILKLSTVPLASILLWLSFYFLGIEMAFVITSAAVVLYISVVSARWAFVLWLLSISMLPFWAGIRYFAYIPPSTLVGIAVLLGILVRKRTRPNGWDYSALYFFALIAALGTVGVSLPGHVVSVLSQWALSYIIGRYLVEQAGREFVFRAIAFIFTVVAVLVLFEFAFGWNPYYATNSGVGQFAKIGEAQERGGIIRAEWAFGHSIALSNSLALAIPIILGSNLKTAARLASVAVICVAGLLTFSRSGIVSILLAVLLAICVGQREITRRMKFLIEAALCVVALVAYPYMSQVFQSASEETTRSADHRLAIFDLFPYINFFGVADDYSETASGVFNWHGVISIDNAFLRMAINFGFLAAAATIVYFVIIAGKVFRMRENLAWVSLLAIFPALFTVALITQFGSLVWFFVGLGSFLTAGTAQSKVLVEDKIKSISNVKTEIG